MLNRTLWAVVLSAVSAVAAATVLVEHVTEKPERQGSLGSGPYSPTENELPFIKKVAGAEQVTGGMGSDYVLSRHTGYVGWFGVVRGVTEEKGRTRLQLEHKGFDGITDRHILAIDFNGGGDFIAWVPGTGHKIEPLTLVKVYGTPKVVKGAIELEAEYVRDWHQGSFTFIMAAGTQHGSEQWRKLNSVPLERIYNPYPNDAYYAACLGKR